MKKLLLLGILGGANTFAANCPLGYEIFPDYYTDTGIAVFNELNMKPGGYVIVNLDKSPSNHKYLSRVCIC